MSAQPRPARDRRGRVYTPAIGPRLKPWLWVALIGFALLGANGAYLSSVTFLQWLRGSLQETVFSMLMFIVHLVLGVLLLVPFVAFGFIHLVTSWNRPNRRAINWGLALLGAGLVVLVSGVMLVRIEGLIDIRDPRVRSVSYWAHVITPLLVVVLYLQHRLTGPRVRWEWAKMWVGSVGLFVLAMGVLHAHDPRAAKRSADPTYTFPSQVKLAEGKLISERAMMMDEYCLKCHKDSYDSWFHSAHHFSSFNNKAYLFSVRETRKVGLERDGNTRAARWCAGCHDPVPFFSGAFDDPNYDDVNTKSSQAGITCTACHAITHVNSTRGNADYTIEEPLHYPFAYSDNAALQWINNTLVKAKPDLHKRTFLKPEVHRNAEFCSACHKVSLPFALNHYQEFTRGQNHYDPFLISGVAGGNAKSFYYPPVAKENCAECHMPLVASKDFGAKDFDGSGVMKGHDHLFPAANTGLATIRGRPDIAAIHEAYLKDNKARVDVFALREGGSIEGELIAPLRPEAPTLVPGRSYLVETVVRTLGVGHTFSQGTVDSNEIWVELIARSGDRVVGRSGGIGEDGHVDPYAHFINVYMLDRDGNRIDRRNPQDIFVPLYNKQIPPGAAQVVHFRLEVAEGLPGPITLEARLNYRKFDRTYMNYVFGPGQGPTLPVVLMASDAVTLPVEGTPGTVENKPSPIEPAWQRWNDYGIGLLLEGGTKGGQKGELRQAEEVFKKVAAMGRFDGWANLARVYIREGRIPDASGALSKAKEMAESSKEPVPTWTLAYFTAQVNEANGRLDEAIEAYRSVLATKIPARKFDFSRDYEVNNSLALALYNRGRLEDLGSEERRSFMTEAATTWLRTIAADSENVSAHYGLGLAFADLSRGVGEAGERADEADVSAPEALLAAARGLSDPGLAAEARAAQAVALNGRIGRFLSSPRRDFSNRLDPMLELASILGSTYEEHKDPTVKASLAAALATTHKALHRMYRPDETAEGRAVAIARRASAAADQNAQSVVIHPLHRPGAPGLDRETPAKVAGPDATNSSPNATAVVEKSE